MCFVLVFDFITRKIKEIHLNDIINLNKSGIIKIGTETKNNNILIGKITKKNRLTIKQRLINLIFKRNTKNKDIFKKITSLKITEEIKGIVKRVIIIKRRSIYCINVNIFELRKISVGDKLSGRHGNKGIISKIIPLEDMPYLEDGTIVDIIMNPLGIPSRMNIGQILESLLGLAGKYLNEKYQIQLFPGKENQNWSETIVYHKLKEASKKTKKKWLFNPNYPVKYKLLNAKTGKIFKHPITTGYSYILKLMHLVEDKLHSRFTGPYSLITQQPLKGKKNKGGQRFGEMEVWALEGFGSAYLLQELLTLKSDDTLNRSQTIISVISKKNLPQPSITESLKILTLQMQCLCLDIKINNPSLSKFF